MIYLSCQSTFLGEIMRLETTIRGKSVNIYNNGDLWVAGKNTNLRQWESDPKIWANQSGQQIKDLKGKTLEEVLRIKGYIWFLLLNDLVFYIRVVIYCQLVILRLILSLFFIYSSFWPTSRVLQHLRSWTWCSSRYHSLGSKLEWVKLEGKQDDPWDLEDHPWSSREEYRYSN